MSVCMVMISCDFWWEWMRLMILWTCFKLLWFLVNVGEHEWDEHFNDEYKHEDDEWSEMDFIIHGILVVLICFGGRRGYNIESVKVFNGPDACLFLAKARATSAASTSFRDDRTFCPSRPHEHPWAPMAIHENGPEWALLFPASTTVNLQSYQSFGITSLVRDSGLPSTSPAPLPRIRKKRNHSML